jgi:hypothetical protein
MNIMHPRHWRICRVPRGLAFAFTHQRGFVVWWPVIRWR